MDEYELLLEQIAEYRELLRALLANPGDALAQQRARHVLADVVYPGYYDELGATPEMEDRYGPLD